MSVSGNDNVHKWKQSMLSAAVPPPLPSRSVIKSKTSMASSYTLPSAPTLTIENCDCPKGACTHCYDKVDLVSKSDLSIYEPLFDTEENLKEKHEHNVKWRLQKIEANQARATLEFNQFRGDILRDVMSLQMSVAEVKDLSKSVEKLVTESSTNLQKMLERMQLQMMENSDHLGKQILDVRRDIMTVSKNSPSTFKK
uniref:Uncharacterized protein n=1 Tax=Arion vulgaris TaxID=1028688 RepID=A0A0B7BDV7_9EUPU